MEYKATDGTVFKNRNEYRKYEMKTQYTFQNRESEILTKRKGSVSGQPFNILKCHSCVIVILDHCEQVLIDGVNNSIIYVASSCSSVFVRNCENCKLIIASKQLRTKNCKYCDFYLYCKTKPVIEASQYMRFAPFNGNFDGHTDLMRLAKLDENINHWYEVYDFSQENFDCSMHSETIKQNQESKNWSFMRPEDIDPMWDPRLLISIIPEGETSSRLETILNLEFIPRLFLSLPLGSLIPDQAIHSNPTLSMGQGYVDHSSSMSLSSSESDEDDDESGNLCGESLDDNSLSSRSFSLPLPSPLDSMNEPETVGHFPKNDGLCGWIQGFVFNIGSTLLHQLFSLIPFLPSPFDNTETSSENKTMAASAYQLEYEEENYESPVVLISPKNNQNEFLRKHFSHRHQRDSTRDMFRDIEDKFGKEVENVMMESAYQLEYEEENYESPVVLISPKNNQNESLRKHFSHRHQRDSTRDMFRDIEDKFGKEVENVMMELRDMEG